MQPMSRHAVHRNDPFVVANAGEATRAEFIKRTYAHLAGALLLFLVVATVLVNWEGAGRVAGAMTRGYNWLIVLALFMGAGWIADKWARSDVSIGMQYLGLGLYVVVNAFIFLPLLYVAAHHSSPEVIPMAGMMTGLLFFGLTATVFMTGKSFSFLRPILAIGSLVALGLIGAGIVFGFNLGLVFAAGMVILASGSILYTTSSIIREYRTNQHVAASLSLFAGVALLFYYILIILMDR